MVPFFTIDYLKNFILLLKLNLKTKAYFTEIIDVQKLVCHSDHFDAISTYRRCKETQENKIFQRGWDSNPRGQSPMD